MPRGAVEIKFRRPRLFCAMSIPYDRNTTPMPAAGRSDRQRQNDKEKAGGTRRLVRPVRSDRRGCAPRRDGTRIRAAAVRLPGGRPRSEEHTSELQSLMRISYAVFCLKKKTNKITQTHS